MDFSTVMRTRTLDDIKQFLDERYPDVGMDCPLFPIMVVLFSAVVYGAANVGWICQFTGYRRAYVNAIATNMVHNGLWQGDRYKASECLQDMGLDPLRVMTMSFGSRLKSHPEGCLTPACPVKEKLIP